MNEAAIEFKNQDNLIMMCITLGHLMSIHSEDPEYVRKLSSIRDSVAENLESPVDSLQQFLEQKIGLAKKLIRLLSELELEIQSHGSQFLQTATANRDFARLATKLNLSRTLLKLKQQRDLPGSPRDSDLERAIYRLEAIRNKLKGNDASTDLAFEAIEQHSFVSSSVHRLKNAVLNIHGVLFLAFCGVPFQKIKQNLPNKFSFDQPVQKIKVQSEIADSKRLVQYVP